ncbi:hypothetical protein OO184_19795 [Photorhabdus sp. APURE]|nr:hypothetical protein [Photorhabdus aballayi]
MTPQQQNRMNGMMFMPQRISETKTGFRYFKAGTNQAENKRKPTTPTAIDKWIYQVGYFLDKGIF